MAKAVAILSLSGLMRAHSRRASRGARPHETLAADCRAASIYLRRFASLLMLEEAKQEPDLARRRELESEASTLWCGHAG